MMSIRKTVGAVIACGGLASGTLLAGLALPASAAPVSPASTAAPAKTASAAVTAARLAPTAAAIKPWPVLGPGTNRAWPKVTVRSLQYLLDDHGAKVTVDGVFGPKTTAAVIAFQRAHHLGVDGVAGAATWRALIVTARLGSKGDAVRAIQDQANYRIARSGYTLAVDGIFGPATQLFVKAFQLVGGLTQDGVVGPQTWQALVSESVTALPTGTR